MEWIKEAVKWVARAIVFLALVYALALGISQTIHPDWYGALVIVSAMIIIATWNPKVSQ